MYSLRRLVLGGRLTSKWVAIRGGFNRRRASDVSETKPGVSKPNGVTTLPPDAGGLILKRLALLEQLLVRRIKDDLATRQPARASPRRWPSGDGDLRRALKLSTHGA